jgi:hypothetical protein
LTQGKIGDGRLGRRMALGVAILGTAIPAACASTHPAARQHQAAPAANAPGSVAQTPAPDYASPASVAAAFYVAWASVDTVHDGPGAMAARCAPLVTPQLERQLTASQPATATWAAMRLHRTVVLVRILAVTRPDGSPAATSSRAYLRVYAERITLTTARQTAAPDGVTVELSKVSRRWLVARILFF